ncbi:MAG: PcfB family protein [Lachnospiraceae bacterium]|nr:PcfB family protein [Lachnospiraceae bacterium]
MQEEVENRAVNLAISTTKLTARTVMNGVRLFLNHRSKVKVQKAQKAAEGPHGKQSVRQLIGQNQGVSTIPIAETDLKGFEKVAKKYGVDFAIRKDSSVSPPRYTVFFKARDTDALASAYKEYSAQAMQRAKRPSVRKQLAKLIAFTASIPSKVRQKSQEHSL